MIQWKSNDFKRNDTLQGGPIIIHDEPEDNDAMKLVIKNSERLESIFPREAEPDYVEDKIGYYDSKKLQQWEHRFNEILTCLNEPDNQEGIDLLFSLAKEGYPEARRLLSDMYMEGRGLPENFLKAVEWDRRAQYAERFYRERL